MWVFKLANLAGGAVSEQVRIGKGNNNNVRSNCLENKYNRVISRKLTNDWSGGKFRCLYFNARSIISLGKRTELEMYVKSIDPICIGITETWTKSEIDDSELDLKGYTMFRKDRENQKTRGHGAGGVLLYVKEELHATERIDIKDEKFRESIWCEIKYEKQKVLIGVCYRTPDSTEDINNGLCKLVGKVSKERTVIMGDFNYHIDWNNLEAERPQDKVFMECINDNF